MKKGLFVALTAAMFLGLSSCANEPKLLTEAELQKKVAEQTAAKTDVLKEKLDSECSANMDALVNYSVDSILQAKRAEAALVK